MSARQPDTKVAVRRAPLSGAQGKPRRWKHPGNDLVLGRGDNGSLVGLSYEARSGHLYVPGRTGSGKSRFLTSLLLQDIALWSRTKCGLLLLDPHGEIVDSLLAYLARTPKYKRLPIVFIDLARDDRLVGYSPLRLREGVSPAVAASQFVEAMLHGFGQVDPTATPTIARVLSTVIQTLLVARIPLPEVFTLLDPEQGDMRAALLSRIDDAVARSDFERLHRLTKPRFEEEVLGPVNRLSAFLRNPLLRTILGQPDGGFSFDWAIREGAIVLVSLATRGAKITPADGKLFASLMLTDLWQAAMTRGKKGAGEIKPFYVYIDEVSSLCTPTIAQNLDQARGFGLHFTLANQMLSQFESYGGPYGRAIRKSVIANTLSKVCFRQSTDEEDLTPLVRTLFLGQFDPRREKHVLTSFQTVGYQEVERWTRSVSTTKGRSQGRSTSESASESWSESDTWSESSGTTGGETMTDGYTEGSTTSDMPDSSSGSYTDSQSWSTASSSGWSESAGYGGGRTEGGSRTTARGLSIQTSESVSEGRHQQISERPILKERVSSIQYYSLPEQVLEFEQRLTTLRKREALVLCDGWDAPRRIRTLEVVDPVVRPEWIERFRGDAMAQHAFWLTLAVKYPFH